MSIFCRLACECQVGEHLVRPYFAYSFKFVIPRKKKLFNKNMTPILKNAQVLVNPKRPINLSRVDNSSENIRDRTTLIRA